MITDKAKQMVDENRQEQYGNPVKNYTDAAMISSMLRNKVFNAQDIVTIMIVVKLIRQRNKHKEDNLIDIAGYTEILNRINKIR